MDSGPSVCAADGRLNIDFHRLLIKASLVVVVGADLRLPAFSIVLHGELVSCRPARGRPPVRHREGPK